MKKESEFSYEKISSLIQYDSDNGEFYWVSSNKKENAGVRAGYKKPGRYEYICIDGRVFPAHRVAFILMTKSWPSCLVDHIDRDKHNNKWENLRLASRAENSFNRKVPSNSTSGVAGVTFYKANGRWRAHIKVKNKKISLGYFKTLEEAAAARKMAEVKYFGDFSPR